MTEMFRRHIRVEGKPDDVKGYSLTVHDAQTGEQLLFIADIDMHLSARSLSTATVTYYEVDEHGKLLIKDGKPVVKTALTDNPEVSVTAMETMPLIEQLQEEVRIYREATIKAIEDRRARAERQGEIHTLVLSTLVQASVECWNKHPDGIFSSQKAHWLARSLMRDINEYAGVAPLEPVEPEPTQSQRVIEAVKAHEDAEQQERERKHREEMMRVRIHQSFNEAIEAYKGHLYGFKDELITDKLMSAIHEYTQ